MTTALSRTTEAPSPAIAMKRGSVSPPIPSAPMRNNSRREIPSQLVAS